MRPIDFLQAAAVALAVIVSTLVGAFPMVAFYAYVIEPGHPPEFYTAAAQWIAPWSSHLLGPLLFLAFNRRLARRHPARNAFAFAVTCVALYVIIDVLSLPLFGAPMSAFFSLPVAISLAVKLSAALGGAWLGSRTAVAPR